MKSHTVLSRRFAGIPLVSGGPPGTGGGTGGGGGGIGGTDLPLGSWYGQIPLGAVDGVNCVFYLDYVPVSPYTILLIRGLEKQQFGTDPDYTRIGNVITTTEPPFSGDTLAIYYFIGGSSTSPAPGAPGIPPTPPADPVVVFAGPPSAVIVKARVRFTNNGTGLPEAHYTFFAKSNTAPTYDIVSHGSSGVGTGSTTDLKPRTITDSFLGVFTSLGQTAYLASSDAMRDMHFYVRTAGYSAAYNGLTALDFFDVYLLVTWANGKTTGMRPTLAIEQDAGTYSGGPSAAFSLTGNTVDGNRNTYGTVLNDTWNGFSFGAGDGWDLTQWVPSVEPISAQVSVEVQWTNPGTSAIPLPKVDVVFDDETIGATDTSVTTTAVLPLLAGSFSATYTHSVTTYLDDLDRLSIVIFIQGTTTALPLGSVDGLVVSNAKITVTYTDGSTVDLLPAGHTYVNQSGLSVSTDPDNLYNRGGLLVTDTLVRTEFSRKYYDSGILANYVKLNGFLLP